MNASLNEKLRTVKWGEYKLCDLFTSQNGDFDIKKIHINGKGEYVITAGLSNNGVLGKSDVNAKIFKKNTITVDMFGNAFYRQFDYKMVTHARVFSLEANYNITERQGLFLANSFCYLSNEFGFDNMCSWEKIKTKPIQLPYKNGKIDFDFMESFVAELEAERVAELSAYLKVSGFDNYELSVEELNALQRFDELGDDNWGTYNVGNLFEKVATKKLPYKAKELPKQPIDGYVLPCLTSSFQNQGLNYYAPKAGATVISNVISLPSNSDVYRAYYQSRDFTVLSDSYAIQWKLADNKPTPNQYLFMVMCINKVTDLPIYSYKNKLGGWNVVQHKEIRLPVNDGKIDFVFMETFISAIKKLVIKDVVKYSNTKIAATKTVVSDNNF
ncbi:restriction endonuclease subunit S [uncultured Eubacterium sp.]|uniref:restriction endonuclease subunit S n=1 Tax=uncultured Eubacterium sp. TaxID=165185 RepID=UPI00345498CD